MLVPSEQGEYAVREKKLGIVGAGRIGACEATLMAGHGFETVVLGVSGSDLERCRGILEENFDELIREGLASEANKKASLGLLRLTTDYKDLSGCDFVLEASLEDIQIKHAVYQALEEVGSKEMLIASTTSALPADELSAGMKYPQRFCVAHPFQPAHLLPLVELVGGELTATETLCQWRQLLEALGRQVVTLKKSVPGFVVNRFAQALFREAVYLMEQGVVDAEDIDKAVKYAMGMRYASIGLLEYFDDVGFQLESDIASTVYPDLCGVKAVQNRVKEGIASGETGLIADKGLHDWAQKDKADYFRRKASAFYGCFDWDMPT